MATKRNKKIFDDGAILVEQTYPTDDVAVVSKKTRSVSMGGTKTINVTDVLDTYAGYIPQRFGMNDGAEDSGECIICGAKTQYPLRKICVPCLEKYGDGLYEACKLCIENGEDSFSIKINE